MNNVDDMDRQHCSVNIGQSSFTALITGMSMIVNMVVLSIQILLVPTVMNILVALIITATSLLILLFFGTACRMNRPIY